MSQWKTRDRRKGSRNWDPDGDQSHFGLGLSNALSPVRTAASSSFPHSQFQPGPFHEGDSTQALAEEVEPRENYGIAMWAGLSVRNHTKRRTDAVNSHSGPCPPGNHHDVWTHQPGSGLLFLLDGKNVEWELLPSLGLEVEMLEEDPSFMDQNGVWRRAG